MTQKNESPMWSEQSLTNDLLRAILADCTDCEAEYQIAAAALSAVLTRQQRKMLAEAEQLCLENLRYALRFGFVRGVLVGMTQTPEEQASDYFFENAAVIPFCSDPKTDAHNAYYQRMQTAQTHFQALQNQLGTVFQLTLDAIPCTWDFRLQHVLERIFALGLHTAHSIPTRPKLPQKK